MRELEYEQLDGGVWLLLVCCGAACTKLARRETDGVMWLLCDCCGAACTTLALGEADGGCVSAGISSAWSTSAGSPSSITCHKNFVSMALRAKGWLGESRSFKSSSVIMGLDADGVEDAATLETEGCKGVEDWGLVWVGFTPYGSAMETAVAVAEWVVGGGACKKQLMLG